MKYAHFFENIDKSIIISITAFIILYFNNLTGVIKIVKRIDLFLQKYFMRIFFSILLITTILYILLAFGGGNIWHDESFTFAMIRYSYKDIWQLTAADVHPPLYYFVLKFLTSPFNYSLFSAELVSIFPYVFILAFGGIQFRRLFNEKVAIIFMFLFFLFPFSMSYANEIRMYSLAAAFVFASSVYAYRCYLEPSVTTWALYVICGVGAAYTHYYALVSVCVVHLMLFIAIISERKTQLKNWFKASLFAFILYLPWLKMFVIQIHDKIVNKYWIPNITIISLLGYCYSLFKTRGFYLFFLFSGLMYLTALIYTILYKKKSIALCGFLVVLGTAVIGIIVSWLVRPVFIIRYVIPSIPLIVTFMAIFISEMKSEFLAGAMLTIALIGGVSHYGDLLYTEYFPAANELNSNFTLKYHHCNSYIILTKEGGDEIPAVLWFYEREIPIYYDIKALPPENPFKDVLHPIKEFDKEKANSVIIFTEVGETPPEKYLSYYDSEYIGKMSEHWNRFSVFILRKKVK